MVSDRMMVPILVERRRDFDALKPSTIDHVDGKSELQELRMKAGRIFGERQRCGSGWPLNQRTGRKARFQFHAGIEWMRRNFTPHGEDIPVAYDFSFPRRDTRLACF